MAAEGLAQGDATGWFERFYQQAGGDWDRVPWADLRPNPYLVAWLRTFGASPTRKRCLVVGCGLGDDAEALASAGFEVTAFDISPTAIAAAQRRFPRSGVDYVVADILQPPPAWTAAFDLIFEAFTLQALPPEPRHAAIGSMASLVAPGGRIFVLCRAREASEPAGRAAVAADPRGARAVRGGGPPGHVGRDRARRRDAAGASIPRVLRSTGGLTVSERCVERS